MFPALAPESGDEGASQILRLDRANLCSFSSMHGRLRKTAPTL
jgi:hypothetical protein